MALPIRPLARDTFDLDGQPIEYRSLSRSEVTKLSTLTDTGEAEVFIVASSTGSTTDEAIAWLASVDATTANDLLTAISILSGLRKVEGEAGKASPSKGRSSGR